MEALSPKQKEIRQLQHDLLQTLFAQSPRQCPVAGLPPQQQWLSTRQLANAVNVGVYRARRLLLDLVARQEVIVTDGSINNSLRWYPTALLDGGDNNGIPNKDASHSPLTE
ncbi:hypothetical protein G4234_03975 [Serratia marcescens]|uniref:hypothetical protein n=1 Tax=Serratia marcescens TaxID=615 RepID=UPI00141A5ECE|nr:hypothetical protein [Serratia marcescens]NIA32876.1 hypothetical protein [Serratia marcescens]